jgi:hypothetical protein
MKPISYFFSEIQDLDVEDGDVTLEIFSQTTDALRTTNLVNSDLDKPRKIPSRSF